MKSKTVIKHTIQGVEFKFSYNKLAVNAVKRIPSNLRRWDNAKKVWIVANSELPELIRICRFIIGSEPNIIGKVQTNTGQQTKLIKVKYIGQPKDRGDGQNTVFACDFSDEWNIIFSEDILKNWFECGIGGIEKKTPVLVVSKYALLGIAKSANGSEIKKAYRNASKRFHPDVNHDSDAEDIFIKIKEAYDMLQNPLSRRRYDAGMAFAEDASKSTQKPYKPVLHGAYRPPVRCGWIMATGKYEVGRFMVEKILKWEPIIKNGMELVTSWNNSKQEISEEWI